MFTILIMKTFLPKKDPLKKYKTSAKSLETLAHIAESASQTTSYWDCSENNKIFIS